MIDELNEREKADDVPEICPVCNLLLKTCEELGNRKFCADLIEDMKQNKIEEKELIDRVMEHFPKFQEKLEENI